MKPALEEQIPLSTLVNESESSDGKIKGKVGREGQRYQTTTTTTTKKKKIHLRENGNGKNSLPIFFLCVNVPRFFLF
jgi:hypothetical protein